MKILPNTEISQKELEKRLNSPFRYGGEAVILNGSTERSLYKVFLDFEHYDAVDELGIISIDALTDMSDNKFNKIKAIHTMELDGCVRPLSTLTVAKRLIGYEMTYDKDDFSMLLSGLSLSQKIHGLEQAKRILEYFATKDITYGDVASRNILINRRNGEINFCDMDNIRLKEFPIDVMSDELEHYFYVRGLDESTDTYMHNLLTIQQIDGWGPYEIILNAIGNRHYPNGFKRQAKKIFKSMESPELFNGESVMQYVKK